MYWELSIRFRHSRGISAPWPSVLRLLLMAIWGVNSAMAFILTYRSVAVEENFFEMKQLVWLKSEAMNEEGVKLWRVFVSKKSRVFAFR